MKILYFTQLFYPAFFGGGEYIFYQWAKELVKKGHRVFVITQRIENTKPYEVINGIEIFRVGSEIRLEGTLPMGIFLNLSFLVLSILKGIEIIRKNKIDIIHSNTYVPVISAQLCSSFLKIPHIATIHDVYYTSKKDFWKSWSNQNGTSKLTRFVGPIVEKMISKMPVTLFHTVSDKSKSDLEALGITKKIVIIPNGIDPAQYCIENKKSKNQAIFVGRLVFYKNLDVVIEAFTKVVKKIPDAKLVIVGEGPIKKDLIEKSELLGIRNSILFTGNISDEEKIRLISESKVLLNPSLIEGFGIVVLEGFACGKPVIVSDTKPLSNLVDNHVDGFIVSSSDSDEWANRIIELISNSSLAEKMGKVGKEKTSSNYSILKLVDNLLELYSSLTKKT